LVRYRWARQDDLEELLNLIGTGFTIRADAVHDRQQGKEHRILFNYLYSRPTWQPDWVWVGEADGRLVVAVGVFPQQLYLGETVVPVWAISPVVTHPDFRGQGLGGECLLQALDRLKERGIAAVFLWGIPDFYPRYGFVPLLPRYKTRLRQEQLRKETSGVQGHFRTVRETDLLQIAELYNRSNREFWLQPHRDLRWWHARFAEMDIDQAILKEVPYPIKENFRVWENNNGELAGYLYFQRDPLKLQVEVTETGATDFQNALAMVKNFIDHHGNDKQEVFFRGTPQHPLNMAAYRWGGTHVNPAPLAGMIKIINWPGFLQQIASLIYSKFTLNHIENVSIPFHDPTLGKMVRISAGGIEVANFADNAEMLNVTQMTRLLFGLYDRNDGALLKLGKMEMESLFPPRYPFIWDANYLY